MFFSYQEVFRLLWGRQKRKRGLVSKSHRMPFFSKLSKGSFGTYPFWPRFKWTDKGRSLWMLRRADGLSRPWLKHRTQISLFWLCYLACTTSLIYGKAVHTCANVKLSDSTEVCTQLTSLWGRKKRWEQYNVTFPTQKRISRIRERCLLMFGHKHLPHSIKLS